MLSTVALETVAPSTPALSYGSPDNALWHDLYWTVSLFGREG
jgi:hypothetical protein